ncbi:MAG: hypothetical protein V8Q84_11275 [Bilophila sp.]
MILCGVFWSCVQLGFSEYLGVAGERESARIWQEEVRKKNLAATVLHDVWFADGDWIVSSKTLDPKAQGTGFSGYELSEDGLGIERIVQASSFFRRAGSLGIAGCARLHARRLQSGDAA